MSADSPVHLLCLAFGEGATLREAIQPHIDGLHDVQGERRTAKAIVFTNATRSTKCRSHLHVFTGQEEPAVANAIAAPQHGHALSISDT